MAYIDRMFYEDTFVGNKIPASEFDRIATIASDVIYSVCVKKPTATDVVGLSFKQAVCYQAEMIYEQGGVESIVGFSETSRRGDSERLGDYSISSSANPQSTIRTIDGVPVSSLAIMKLRSIGLMSRCVYD